jgi:hypothetical protein
VGGLAVKICSICKQEKEKCFFSERKNRKGEIVLRTDCKDCERARYKKYYTKNRAKRIAQQVARDNRSAEIRARKLQYGKTYRLLNANKLRAKRADRKDKIRENEKRFNSLPQNKIARAGRVRIRTLLKGGCMGRSRRLLGCSPEEARVHIESLFQPGMTWQNYGQNGWHIDHIIPCAMFDLKNSEEAEVCFHWTNLQPLWAKDNLSKRDRYILPTDASGRKRSNVVKGVWP